MDTSQFCHCQSLVLDRHFQLSRQLNMRKRFHTSFTRMDSFLVFLRPCSSRGPAQAFNRTPLCTLVDHTSERRARWPCWSTCRETRSESPWITPRMWIHFSVSTIDFLVLRELSQAVRIEAIIFGSETATDESTRSHKPSNLACSNYFTQQCVFECGELDCLAEPQDISLTATRLYQNKVALCLFTISPRTWSLVLPRLFDLEGNLRTFHLLKIHVLDLPSYLVSHHSCHNQTRRSWSRLLFQPLIISDTHNINLEVWLQCESNFWRWVPWAIKQVHSRSVQR